MLNPVHLQTLVAVIDTGSFADAARRLGYTGSAVSQQMAALERSVRVPLFTRSAHSVAPTPVAAMLAERSVVVLAGLTSLEQDLAAMGCGEVGHVRVGAFPTISRRLLPTWLAHHQQAHPQVVVDVDEGEPPLLIKRLMAADLEVALVYRYDHVPRQWPATLHRQRLLSEDLVLLVAGDDPLVERVGSVRLDDLADRDWIGTREATDGARCVAHMCAARGFEPRVRYRSNDYGVIRELVAAGLGVACVPSLGFEPSASIRAVRLEGLQARRHIVALSRVEESQPAVGVVVDSLVRMGAAYEGNIQAASALSGAV